MTDIKKYKMLIVMIILTSAVISGINGLLAYGAGASYILAVLCTAAALIIYPLLFRRRAIVSFASSDGWLKKCAAVICTAVFIMYASSFTAFFVEYFRAVFFKQSPFWYILMYVVLPSATGCYFGVKSVSRYAGIVVVSAIGLILLIMVLGVGGYNADNLFPLFGSGAAGMGVGLINTAYFGGVVVYYLLVSVGKCQLKHVSKNVAVIIAISGAVVAIVCLCTNLLLPYNAAMLVKSPLYTIASSVRGSYLIERTEAVVLVILLFAAYICISGITSVNTLFCTEAFKLSNNNALTGCVFALISLLSVVYVRFDIVDYMYKLSVYGLGILSVVLPSAVNIGYIFGEKKL